MIKFCVQMPWHKLLSLESMRSGGLEGVWLRHLRYEVCVSKDFCEYRKNCWSDRGRRGTVRLTDPPER